MSDIADLLRRAATLLTSSAADADGPAPWRVAECHVYDNDGECIARTDPDRAAGIWEAQWIALTHPGIAQPLAAWLRSEARSAAAVQAYVASIGKSGDPDMAAKTAERHQHPIALARAILGEDG